MTTGGEGYAPNRNSDAFSDQSFGFVGQQQASMYGNRQQAAGGYMQGPVGVTGSSGTKGPEGPVGSVGYQGAQGSQGPHTYRDAHDIIRVKAAPKGKVFSAAQLLSKS